MKKLKLVMFIICSILIISLSYMSISNKDHASEIKTPQNSTTTIIANNIPISSTVGAKSTTQPLAADHEKDKYSFPQTQTPLQDAKYVSAKAINIVKGYLRKGKEQDLFKNERTGKLLNKKEIENLKCKDDVRQFIKDISQGGSYNEFFLVDIDNDKQNEIFVSMVAGSGAFLYLAVLEQGENGVYYFSEYPYSEITTSSAVNSGIVNLGGTNYYIEGGDGSVIPVGTSIQIYAFKNGLCVEHLVVKKYIDKYKSLIKTKVDKRYETLMDSIVLDSENALRKSDKDQEFFGKAEMQANTNDVLSHNKDINASRKFWKKCDIDNDRNNEIIFRQFNYTKHSRYYKLCIFKNNKFINFNKMCDIGFDEFNFVFDVLQVWFEKSKNINYFCVLTCDEENVYYTDVYKISKNGTIRIGRIETNQVIGPYIQVWTEGINIKFEHLARYEGTV